GQEFGRRSWQPSAIPTTIFVDELFAGMPQGFAGDVTFESDTPISALALRQSWNDRREPLFAVLPIVDLALFSSLDADRLVPVAAGAGLSSRIVLINRSSESVTGVVRLVADNGLPLSLIWNGQRTSSFPYEIAGNGVFEAILDEDAGTGLGHAIIGVD